jgi:hypothetical protein
MQFLTERLKNYTAYNTSILLCIKIGWATHVARKGRQIIVPQFA